MVNIKTVQHARCRLTRGCACRGAVDATPPCCSLVAVRCHRGAAHRFAVLARSGGTRGLGSRRLYLPLSRFILVGTFAVVVRRRFTSWFAHRHVTLLRICLFVQPVCAGVCVTLPAGSCLPGSPRISNTWRLLAFS
jgi:hypothetical protein